MSGIDDPEDNRRRGLPQQNRALGRRPARGNQGLKHDLPAVSGFRFSLRSAHQPCTLALPAHAFRNEEIADIAGAPPSPAIETARTRAICGAQKDADETPVRDAGRSHVEINKTVLEEVNVLKARFGLHDQALGGRAV